MLFNLSFITKHCLTLLVFLYSSTNIESTFRLQAMAALNARKMKFSPLKGAFSEKGLNEFLL